jgi:hypothetical protein
MEGRDLGEEVVALREVLHNPIHKAQVLALEEMLVSEVRRMAILLALVQLQE